MDVADEARIFHPPAQMRTGLDDVFEDVRRGLFCLIDFLLVHHDSDAGLGFCQWDNPDPFVFEPHDTGIATGFSFVVPDAFKKAKDKKFLQSGMYLSNAFLVACEIAAATGIDEEMRFERLGFAAFVASSDGDAGLIIGGFGDGPALSDVSA